MLNVAHLRETAEELRACAERIRRHNEKMKYQTADNTGLLDQAAKILEELAAEAERSQSE